MLTNALILVIRNKNVTLSLITQNKAVATATAGAIVAVGAATVFAVKKAPNKVSFSTYQRSSSPSLRRSASSSHGASYWDTSSNFFGSDTATAVALGVSIFNN